MGALGLGDEGRVLGYVAEGAVGDAGEAVVLEEAKVAGVDDGGGILVAGEVVERRELSADVCDGEDASMGPVEAEHHGRKREKHPRHLPAMLLLPLPVAAYNDLAVDPDARRAHILASILAAGHSVLPCKRGFLLCPPRAPADWGAGWEHKALSRPLVFCHLELLPTPDALYLRPTLLPTPYLPLDADLPRAPILLLPHATPAYFLASYAGPTAALVRQFSDALPGIPILPSFVIGWISVENRRGEDKGITFIYPSQLCLAFAPAFSRPPLDHIPDLPAPLQPSPKLPAAPHRPSLLGSPSTELRAFRALTLSRPKNIRSIAAQVSSYVDHVAKDRDRERERLKRERTIPQTPSAPPPPHPPYPSPPQAETTAVPIPANTSPVLPPQPPPPILHPVQPQPPAPAPPYDPFGYLSDMDFGMDFGMSMSMNQSENSNPNPSRTGDRSAFGIDFDEVTDDDFNFFDAPSTQATLLQITSPPLFDDVPASGPGPPQPTPRSQQMATPVFTPDSLVPLLPSPSPDPISPNVHLEVSPPQKGFDPIPFANYHRIADGKYAPTGKFGLPSPPPDEPSWRTQYNAITDPRVGVVRKLKRKRTTQGGRHLKQNHWAPEHEEWATDRPCMDGSDDETSQSEEEPEDEDTPATSRPCTPPPSYLPLGPTLLQTQFLHAHLLPLSKPLRPPGSSISGSANQAAATPAPVASVPTPVSPAAGLGLTAEKWKTLEVVVNFLAKEAIENAVWRDAWSASNAFGKGTQGKKLTEIWVSDVKMVEKIFESLDDVQENLSMDELFGSPRIMNAPKISLAKSDAIVNILPPALRFWGKLGLGPKNGEKSAIVYVLFADDGEQHRQREVASWLDGVRTAYEVKRLGLLEPGTYVKDGLFPIKFDLSFRKHFDSLITNITGSSTPIILFLVVPITLTTLFSTIFRRIISSMQKSIRAHPSSQIIVQLVPEHVINYMENDPASTSQLESFCMNLYNRILVPIDQPLARRFSPDNTPISIKALLQKPVFTLARPTYNTVTYTRTAFSSLDVMDRYTLLHVGYRISACGKWVMAACVDQRGEAWEQAIWLLSQDVDGEGNGSSASIGGGSEEMSVVKRVWDFVAGFAVRADVEWRIVISKLGIMEEVEFTAWTTLLPAALTMDYPRSVHVSLFCVDPDSPWLFTKFDAAFFSSQPDSNNNQSAVFSDTSSTTYSAFFNIVIPITTPPSQLDIGISLPYVADPSCAINDGDPDSTNSPSEITTADALPTVASTIPRKIGLVPKSTSCLIRVPCFAPLTSISMLGIHLLSTYSSSSLREEDTNNRNNNKSNMLDSKVILADVTHNFYELSVLAQLQWKLSGTDGVATHGGGGNRSGGGGDTRFKTGANPILPVHLAMVDIMGQVADGADCTEIDS